MFFVIFFHNTMIGPSLELVVVFPSASSRIPDYVGISFNFPSIFLVCCILERFHYGFDNMLAIQAHRST